MSEYPTNEQQAFESWSNEYLSGHYCDAFKVLTPMRAAWQARAKLATEQIGRLEAERERAVKACEQLRAQILTLKAGRWEAAEILKAARCPDCDGSGAIPYGDPNGDFEIEQCRWCYDRDETLAKIDAQRRGDDD